MRCVQGPAVNEPLFINRETVFQLADFSKPDVGVIKLKLTQKIGDHRLVVYASQFEPLPGDKLSYTLKDRETGKISKISMPHFCLTNYNEVHGNILKYINLAKKTYLHTLEDVGGLTWEIVSMAMKYAETNKVNPLTPINASHLANITRAHLLIRLLISGLSAG